jgi:hypothetical protein
MNLAKSRVMAGSWSESDRDPYGCTAYTGHRATAPAPGHALATAPATNQHHATSVGLR